MTAFFIPNIDEGTDEEVYEGLADLCGRMPAEHGRRIESITFVHDGEEWIATVGSELRGTRTTSRRRKAGVVEVTERLSDGASVLAIFAGTPYIVVTNKGTPGVRSRWENPFYAGQPTAVRYFATSV